MSTVTIDTLLIERPTRYGNTTGYNVAEIIAPNIPNPAGSGPGAAVTVSIVASESNLPADLEYTIEPTASQPCSFSYANKTTSGFDIVLTPLSSGATLSAGTIDVVVTWDRG